MTWSPPPSDSPQALRARLSRDLGLVDEPQDWGIINADESRLEEFVAFLDGVQLAPTQAFDLVDLILASANERLLRDPLADLEAVGDLLSRHEASASVHGDYWSGLHDAAAYPVGAWLRERHKGTSS